ncbi:hypothetical protein COEREDRAFT_84060 [Coemansia reversa NRRL 1564]|uniref:Uncharacterized protein n=1 Tax=Coemansia reversa (strain ATCC 12441 / NRRL 1564) TaxID=763665 RepID=A0A2G5B0J5_COERN|nr:hypothetical protein COEREDRAFT_84060 [Coemansia reversa NRRL 1564]|eukprot:PIA12542.1 hypothetical protein COEREDRAFT_84060 [Coemansia reversa NRRL 1564]
MRVTVSLISCITGPLSQNGLCQSEDLALKVDSLEHTTINRMSRIADCLYHLQTIVKDNRRTLENSSNNLQEYAIDSRKDLEKEEKSKYIREMDKRNEDFDKRLRQEHHEFTQMHAQRLSKVLQDQL